MSTLKTNDHFHICSYSVMPTDYFRMPHLFSFPPSGEGKKADAYINYRVYIIVHLKHKHNERATIHLFHKYFGCTFDMLDNTLDAKPWTSL